MNIVGSKKSSFSVLWMQLDPQHSGFGSTDSDPGGKLNINQKTNLKNFLISKWYKQNKIKN